MLGLLMMVAVGYSEEARAYAQPPILPRGGPGQNDVVAPAFLAWSREEQAARCLDASLAVLAAAAARILERQVHPSLDALREACAPVVAALRSGRAFGYELEQLAAVIRKRAVPVV
jgi:hypothetical protein